VTVIHLATGLASAAALRTLLATAAFAIANRAGGRTRVRVAAMVASFLVIPTALAKFRELCRSGFRRELLKGLGAV